MPIAYVQQIKKREDMRESKRGDVEEVLGTVCEELAVEREVVLGRCRRVEVVDARMIVVEELWRRGLYVREISGVTGLSDKRVRELVGCVARRVRGCRVFAEMSDKLRRKLERKVGREGGERM